MLTLDCARGARRTCAAGVVAGTLQAADIVAVIAEPETQMSLADRVREELESRRDTRVVSALGELSDWLEAGYRGWEQGSTPPAAHAESLASWHAWAHADPCVRRSILLWTGVDECVQRDEERFLWLVRMFVANITEPQPEIRAPIRLHKAVLIGGDALEERLELLSDALPDDSRFRYVIVR